VLLIAVPAFFIRFIIWIITISIDTGSNIAWKSTTLLKWRKLFTPDILSQDGLLDGLYITVSITLTAWLICIFIAIILSFLSYNYSYLRVPVSILMWLSNFHLLFGFLFLYFKWEGEVTPEWLWATVIVIFLNGSLSGMTKKFIEQINETFSQKYILFAISQGINKWKAGRNELIVKFIYNALELLPFFLISTIIVELVFGELVGLGKILLMYINQIINYNYDRVDEIFFTVFLLITIIRLVKIFSIWIESRMNINLASK